MRLKTRLLSFGVMAAVATAVLPGAAMAADAEIGTETLVHLDIPGGPAAAGLNALATQAGLQLFYPFEAVKGRSISSVKGDFTRDQAIQQMAMAAGLRVEHIDGQTVTLAPQSGSAAGDGADGTVQALVVTAQKREENIQDVPIAMSAFTQEALERSQVAGGPDLITQVPNMTFTKTNFSSYSIQLRGIGTQAISATVDPAVAVAFNNTPFIRNRFFEQEFYDLQRVEVLRGPQGTLYGRNATAGVVNLISQKARLGIYEAKLSADIANYGSHRLEGMVNIPLANEVGALRIAGAWTKRDGYSVNEVTGNPIDGRDLWSTRVSLRFAPNDRLDANLIWEHFEENDDRIRSGKQLCKTDVVDEVAGFATPNFYQPLTTFSLSNIFAGVQATFSQGCSPASLYSPDSFQKTNSLALPYFAPLGAVGLPIVEIGPNPIDPYASRTQSTDLRIIEAAVDPTYRAKTDVAELQFAYDLTDQLTLNSETSWASDFIFSTQDYNRFAGASGVWDPSRTNYAARGILSADGVFCDPQIGCSDRLVAMDLSTARSAQFSQELRLSSDFEGPFNFSLGANFLRYDTEDKYYVFINSLTMMAAYLRNGQGGVSTTPWVPNVTDNRDCLTNGMVEPDFSVAQPILQCTYIDPNPIASLNDLGHNYFLSRNPYKLISYAVFGEAYYKLAENLKLTAGLRWTVDKKEAPLIPSWLFAANTVGHPVFETVDQEWREPTGRLALDWKPDLAFTDETMVYASYAHGYKAGGMNPPPYGKALYRAQESDLGSLIAASSALHPKTFEPEFVDAFEVGAKNTLLDGALTMNLAGFYYDYKGYQLSQIVNRSAVTSNIDADVWGLELESDWQPMENLRFGLKLGYEKTKVADGEQAIDVMDRVAGHEGWVLQRPFPSIPSNCVLPEWLLVSNPHGLNGSPAGENPWLGDVGGKGGGWPGGCEFLYILGADPATADPFTLYPYRAPGSQFGEYFRTNTNYAGWRTDPAMYPCWPTGAGAPGSGNEYPGVDPACLAALSNNGEGFFKSLAGHELPNAPHLTATLTADYTIPLPSSWLMTLHTDLYYQSEAWTRVFNTEGYDKLKAYTNVNFAAIFTNEDAGWKVMAYVKNVFDRDSITGAFLNSDDSGLTTNVFLTEPRLYGLRVTKEFAGSPWWTGANLDHKGPYPLTVELGGQVQRIDAPSEALRADWVDALPAAIAPESVQNRDFDTGDGRSLKMTYRPAGSPWFVTGSIRYGRMNNDTARTNADDVALVNKCRFGPTHFLYPTCDPDFTYYGISYYYAHNANVETVSWSDAEARSREEHHVVEFSVGRDVGIGADVASTLSTGFRGVDFRSESNWAANAQTDWTVPDAWGESPNVSSNRRRSVSLAADRQFKGWGPMLSWDAAAPVWRADAAGVLNIDWSLGAGALFGKRKTNVTGQDKNVLHQGILQVVQDIPDGKSIITSVLPVVDTQITPIDISRSEDATTPFVDLSLGLSYEADRIKVSTGYRWERYFDVLDVGFREAKKADRTIDGPYFRIAVGFGG